MILLIKINYYH